MNMKNVVTIVSDAVEGLTSILASVVILGIFAKIIFGSGFFGVDIVANLISLIEQFVNGGFVGLLALLVVLGLKDK